MKRLSAAVLALLLSSGVIYASDDIYDSFKGSFGMYDALIEMVVLKKIESQTDPETEKMKIGGMALKFEYFENELGQENGLPVAYVHFSDKEDDYVLTYYVEGEDVVKIILFSKNGKFINRELYPAETPAEKEECTKEKKQSK